MNPPDSDVITFIKDFIWAPLLALVGWAWHHNETAHKELHAKDAAQDADLSRLRDQQSVSYSSLNDKFMEHVDARMDATLKLMREGDLRNGDHIAKLFDKLEQHGQRSEDRHRELMTALHTGLAGKADK